MTLKSFAIDRSTTSGMDEHEVQSCDCECILVVHYDQMFFVRAARDDVQKVKKHTRVYRQHR